MPRTAKSSNKRRSRRSGWGWPVLATLLLVAVTAGLLAFARYQSPEARWHRNYEAERAERDVELERGLERSDWRPIHGQLVEYSGRSFPVIVGQTGQWGGASDTGHILLDLTTLRDPRDILAFKLAHEWAHLMLGHGNPHQQHGAVAADAETIPGSSESPSSSSAPGDEGRVHALRLGQSPQSPTRFEDEADAWAGAFLARYNYDLDAVAEYLRDLPYDPKDTTHSQGPRRAELVLSGIEERQR